MTGRRVISAVGMVALAVVTATLVVMALIHGSPRQVVPEAAPSSTDTPTPESTTPESATPTDSPSPSPSQAESPTGESAGEQWDGLRDRWQSDDGELDVLVLGDESGAGEAGWVQLLAETAAQDRPVTYQPWDEDQETYGSIALGEGSGAPLTLHNLSLTEGTAASIADEGQAYEDLDPDVVVLNFGHHEDSDAIAESFDALVESLPGDPPVVALMQNPHADEDSQRAKVRAVREWGEQTRTTVLNVFTAFTGDDRGLAPLLDDQGMLPNRDGAVLWADHVFAELESE